MKGGWTSLVLVSLAAVLSSFLLVHLSMAGVREPVSQADYLPTPRPTEPCDMCEPNNSLSQACGPLAPGKRYQYFIRCTTKPDDDYYYIDLETPGTVTLDLTDIPPGADYDIYLYDENKTLKCYSDRGGNLPEHAECHLGPSGRYYVWVHPYVGCNESDPYVLTVAYPTPPPPPIPTTTPTPPCNAHIDDFGDTNPDNDLGNPSGWELDPSGCGTITVTYTGHELQLGYDVTSPGCTARYTTALSLGASPYEMLTFRILGSDKNELASTVIGLRDEAGHETRVKVGDFLNRVVTNTWEGVDLPLAAFATAVYTTQLDILFVEMTDTAGASQGTIYLDSIRLERPLVPLTVDNFNDLADPNALGGGSRTYKIPTATVETAYITVGTYDNSAASFAISYTSPISEGWILWETDLQGLDASDYDFLSFYIKGSTGSERIKLDLEDSEGQVYPLLVRSYTPISTHWSSVRVPLQNFKDVDLADLTKLKFIVEWSTPAIGALFLDDLRFIADTLLVDNFCDGDANNSLNDDVGLYTSSPSCTAAITPTLSCGSLRLDYDVTAGSDCFSGYWSQTRLDLNPYRTLAVKVRGQRCGQVAAISARTVPIPTDKIKLSGYLPDGITDQWQEARIPLAASTVITDWTRGDAYVIAFEAGQGALKGTAWWDDVAFETACAPLWVDNFNDEDSVNALGGSSNVFGWEAEITSTTSIIQACGDVGAGLVLTYAVLVGRFAGWETELRNVDLSGYDRLIFQVKGAAGGETFHIYLKDGDGNRGFVEIEKYAIPSTEWQTIVIELQSFYGVDLTRVQTLQFVIEYEPADVEGTLFFDNIRFLPSADCSQITRNLVYMPLIAKGYTPLVLDPVWDFESGTEGWTHQTYVDSQAVVAVAPSSLRSRWGNASLAMIVDLVGGDDNKSQGEAFVDVKHHPLSGVSAPLNLECKPLSCWIYVPTCGLGDQDKPNLVQLFVKDANGKSEYGTPTRVVRNQWFEVGIRPSTLQPDGGHKDAGFDPSVIEHVGVRFKAGREGITYRGKVYVDACGWQEIDPTAVVAVEACPPDKGGERVLPVVPRLEE